MRWINLGLAVVLATMLLIQLTRSREAETPVASISEAPLKVVKERPGRRSRRVEARMAVEEAKRRKFERLRGSAGPPTFEPNGKPIVD